jgi:hypothetical protein
MPRKPVWDPVGKELHKAQPQREDEGARGSIERKGHSEGESERVYVGHKGRVEMRAQMVDKPKEPE